MDFVIVFKVYLKTNWILQFPDEYPLKFFPKAPENQGV